ncbi:MULTISPECIES: cytochrome P450 [Rhizobium]|uniref:cytochrome P450 n=1 Tax=Rhizobium TaxID=379 RepID=UPI001C836F2D|nr:MULTISPECIES: cytochrome P450 [Rhizobium]MBX4899701.1 cytochrome P450 [Rhizobium bangladeshense]MBX5297592.1 cytochrome P450 [Rhizobium sp. NLR15a]MBY3617874.1 cytochrome P450 [Rhizobium bangladeshense]
MDTTIQRDVIPDALERLPAAELGSDPYVVLAKLRERSPAVLIESKGARYWVITRYEDVCRVLSDPTIVRDLVKYRSEINAHCVVRDDERRVGLPKGAHSSVFYQDGEKHAALRRNAARYFVPANLENFADVIHDVAREAVSNIRPGQKIDLIEDYARPVCGRVLCRLAGIPANEKNMQAMRETEAIMSSDKSTVERAAQSLLAWATELVDIKRKEPGEDLFSVLLKLSEEIGMTQDELTSEYILASIGTELLVIAMGSGAFLLLTHPDQLAKALAEPSLFDTGVDEIVRYESSFRFLPPRYTTTPLELGGVTIPAGELLMVSVGGANRDPSFIADADVFDITRIPNGHVGFGHSEHKCLAAQLAKSQTGTALRAFFERFPATTLAEPPEKARWYPGKFQRKLEALPVIPA